MRIMHAHSMHMYMTATVLGDLLGDLVVCHVYICSREGLTHISIHITSVVVWDLLGGWLYFSYTEKHIYIYTINVHIDHTQHNSSAYVQVCHTTWCV